MSPKTVVAPGEPVVFLAGPVDAVVGALLDVEPVFLVDDVLGPVAACLGVGLFAASGGGRAVRLSRGAGAYYSACGP
jgi:hypothetical protein